MPMPTLEEQREYQREWCARRRKEFFADKRCVLCDGTERLELHHRDPALKAEHRIWAWSEEARAKEIEKCSVVCRLCHTAYHQGLRRLRAEERNPCGTYPAYCRGCRCDACRAANAAYRREHNKAAA